MKSTLILSQLDKNRTPSNFRAYLNFLLRLNPSIISNQKSFVSRYLRDQEIMVEIIKFKHRYRDCKIFEYICHYFNCIPMRYDKYYIIIGYDLDAMMCRAYFTSLYYKINRNLRERINKHTRRTHYQRKRGRLGIQTYHGPLLHGTKFSSNLKAGMCNDFMIVIKALLQSNKINHKSLHTYNKLKLKTLRYVSTDVRESVVRIVREYETNPKNA